MANSNTKAILAAVRTALGNINGTGGYTYNLSPSAKRIIGRPTKGTEPRPPFAMIGLGELRSEHGPVIGRYRRTLVIDVMAFAPTSADTAAARQNAAADLLDDVCQAIEADRELGGLVTDLIVNAGTFEGASQGIPGTAGMYAEIEVYWDANSAAGV